MPSFFEFHEYVDMLLIFGECRKSGRAAERLYRERFPNRRCPDHKTFSSTVKILCETGSLPCKQKLKSRTKHATDEANTVVVLGHAVINPHESTRSISTHCDISQSSVCRILKKAKFHPYRIHLHQGLHAADFTRRLEFIANMQVHLHDDHKFLSRILWSDESRFHNNGTVNRHNLHYWANENPKWMRETNFQHIWGVNVWCGIIDGYLIGPYFYQGTLTGERYLQFLRESLPELLEEVPLNLRNSLIFQQDGAPPHNSHIVTNFLNEYLPNR